MYALKNIHLTAYSSNLFETVSKDIVKHHENSLPDLSQVVIFLPNLLSQSLFLEELLKQSSKYGHDAILPPTLTTLRQWVCLQQTPNKPTLSQHARELILVDAIKQQPNLFANANPWSIANELLSLFDAMLLNDLAPDAFNQYYQSNHLELSDTLLHETDIIKILWQAWRQQITHENYIDPVETYANALKDANIGENNYFYCVGLDQLSKLECDFLNKHNSRMLFYSYASSDAHTSRTDHWLKKYLTADTNITESKTSDTDSFSTFLDKVFEINAHCLKQRAEEFAQSFPQNSLDKRLKIYKSNNFEQHTNAIDLQIRLWIHENIKNIGVVTTDRKLVRRLRAILEHANVNIHDAAGWALATTSAAVVIEWWFQIIEERYPAKWIIALVNSPFFPTTEPELHQQAINFFEKEIILKFNIHSGMTRFRNAIDKIQSNNKTNNEDICNYLNDLLDKVNNSSQLLAKLHHSRYPLHRYITELLNSLKPVGLFTNLHNDDAGKQIIELFENQITHFKLVENDMNWSDCRRFISRLLDQQNYKPPIHHTSNSQSVTFCSLEQSRLQHFGALVIASVDKNHFPGSRNNYVFFNEQVRSELNIPTWRDDHARHLHQFRCLLNSADKILITVQTEQNGEKTAACPWLEAIETFRTMAYGDSFTDDQLENLVNQNISSVQIESNLPLPKPDTQPMPALINDIKPNKISISQYQSLVDCPYQYFALTCLKLSATDELQEELDKAEFGSLVHQSIHAFFSDVKNIPGPFTEKISTDNRIKAENMLKNISQKVFSNANCSLNDKEFSNQLWLQRWLDLIPKFIDWEINRQTSFTPYDHEAFVEYEVDDFKVYGRLDRVDKSQYGHAIIDYKTGQTPFKPSIKSGEHVQLPMYALLNDVNSNINTTQVEFVTIGTNNSVKSKTPIKDEELEELKTLHLQRLQAFFQSLNEDIPFTAFADDETCQHCDAFGICRKSFWQS